MPPPFNYPVIPGTNTPAMPGTSYVASSNPIPLWSIWCEFAGSPGQSYALFTSLSQSAADLAIVQAIPAYWSDLPHDWIGPESYTAPDSSSQIRFRSPSRQLTVSVVPDGYISGG